MRVDADRRRNDAISDEMLRRLARDPDLARIRHTVQVTSFGGSGTTALYEHLRSAGADVPATPGEFPFKHQPTPPTDAEVPSGFRVVYPFGDPRDAVVSVFRRGFQGGHYRGMRMQPPAPPVESRLADLRAYLGAGVDDFAMREHFRRWRDRARAYPVLFLRYEALAREWPTLRDFVGLGVHVAPLELRPRLSSWEELPADMREQIQEMYGELADELDRLPDAEVA